MLEAMPSLAPTAAEASSNAGRPVVRSNTTATTAPAPRGQALEGVMPITTLDLTLEAKPPPALAACKVASIAGSPKSSMASASISAISMSVMSK
jgi:hypothetical protein